MSLQTTGTALAAVPQPDNDGQFSSPADGAKWMAAYGIPQTPLNGKIAFLPGWQNNGSVDPEVTIDGLVNIPLATDGSIAKSAPNGCFIVEVDHPDVRTRIKSTGIDFTSQLVIESSPGKEHRYYLESADSLTRLSNIAQTSQNQLSVRVSDQYCVSAGSIHPVTGRQYKVVSHGPLTAITPEEISYC